LQDGAGEPVKRSVAGSELTAAALEEQRATDGLGNPPSNPVHFQACNIAVSLVNA